MATGPTKKVVRGTHSYVLGLTVIAAWPFPALALTDGMSMRLSRSLEQRAPNSTFANPVQEVFSSSQIIGRFGALTWHDMVQNWQFTWPVFLATEIVFGLAFLVTAYLLGSLVVGRNWNANYTRKILGGVMLVVPFALGNVLSYAPNPLHMIASAVGFGLLCCLFAEPVRSKSRFLDIAFASIDRPEDRPHTLIWFLTGYAASSALLIAMIWWVVPSWPAFAWIALAAVAIGDLLAGAVGYRFGRHRYTTTALFTSKTYTRSLEGSACVFVTTALAVVLVGSMLPASQFWAAMILMPAAMTLAEASSPHTWDEPFMFAAAILVALAIVQF